jgi:hypothetical protein
MEELDVENKVLMREKNKDEIEVRRQLENNLKLVEERDATKQELEASKYEIIRLKRDTECYTRYFAQIDEEYEDLRVHIRHLEAGQQEVSKEGNVIIIDKFTEFDQEVEDVEDDGAEYGDFFILMITIHFLRKLEYFLIENKIIF